MAKEQINSAILDRALHFAIDAHKNTPRRGKDFPYIIHCLEAVEIVATITSDQELLAAAALHDTVEDTEVTVEQLREEFGDRIANIVADESDNMSIKNWREKKQFAINRLANATYETKIVAMGDKLSNMRAIARDYKRVGDDLWSLFHAPNGRADHEWHYRGLASALFDLADTNAYQEFAILIDSIWGEDSFAEPALVNLDDYEQSGDGYTALSYNHKSGHSMIKLYSDFIPAEQPRNELKFARGIFKMGIPTPFPGRFVTDGKRNGAEFARVLNKQSFSRAISNNPQDLEKYATLFAQMCKKLHNTPCTDLMFGSISEVARRNVMNCHHLNDAEKAKIIDFINKVPEEDTCTHGDMHIGNILTANGNVYWIDLGDFGRGNHLFDIGMFYMTCVCNPDGVSERLFHLTSQQMLQVWNVFVREYFGADTEAKQKDVDALIRPFAALKMIYYGTIDQMRPVMLSFIKQAFQLD